MTRNFKPHWAGTAWRFLATALRREIVARAVCTAALVGTILAAINHGPELLRGTVEARRWLQIGLTYLVPYCVATFAATLQEMRHSAAQRSAPPGGSAARGQARASPERESITVTGSHR